MLTFPPIETVPLEMTPEGVIRVEGTRVSLDSVIYYFWEGSSPESIVDKFPTLTLNNVYRVIGYYLTHREELDAYLREQERAEDRLLQEIEERFPSVGLRERLAARLGRFTQ